LPEIFTDNRRLSAYSFGCVGTRSPEGHHPTLIDLVTVYAKGMLFSRVTLLKSPMYTQRRIGCQYGEQDLQLANTKGAK
jgi:hypothetical protein